MLLIEAWRSFRPRKKAVIHICESLKQNGVFVFECIWKGLWVNAGAQHRMLLFMYTWARCCCDQGDRALGFCLCAVKSFTFELVPSTMCECNDVDSYTAHLFSNRIELGVHHHQSWWWGSLTVYFTLSLNMFTKFTLWFKDVSSTTDWCADGSDESGGILWVKRLTNTFSIISEPHLVIYMFNHKETEKEVLKRPCLTPPLCPFVIVLWGSESQANGLVLLVRPYW